ncbi:MAG: hypothetical protein LBK95_06540 [Bifidobacteriaceae bacterium]|jgi:hypothetical protein|nr:hypothetical protein [Bifidobacteriaceae bacterium]
MSHDVAVEVVAPGSPAADRWLRLPAECYPDARFRGGLPRDEPALVAGTHLLSPEFEFVPLLATAGGQAQARCGVTLYGSEATAYLGLFECLDRAAAPALFEAARALARERGAARLVGPVDASFWLGYRMKLDHFDSAPYFGEPYNQSHYPELWSEAGFQITERYSSTIYSPMSLADLAATGWDSAALDQLAAKLGVTVRPLRRREFDWAAGQIFELVMARYVGLPEFRPLPRERFLGLFGSLRLVLDYEASMIGLVDDQIVGFITSTPDYGRALDATGVGAALRQGLALARHRPRSRRSICHYMAAASGYRGLGPVLADARGRVIQRRGTSAIGSLIHESVPTSGYQAGAITEVHNYALWAAEL